MIDELQRNYFNNATMGTMRSFYGDENAYSYLQNLNETTGYDGVIVDFDNGEKFAVAWRPEQVKSTSNNSPTSSDEFDG